MSFSQDNGYIPASVSDLMALVMAGVNTQFGTTYDAETFQGTNFYKFFYALIQRLQENEVRTSEIVLKLQQYFAVTNEVITRPNTTIPGIFDYFAAAGYRVSAKKPELADAGLLYLAVDVEDNHARGAFVITSYANLVSGTDDSVTVGATVFTAQVGAATPGAGTFQAATSNSVTAASLAAQINAHATAGALVFADVLEDGVTVRLRAIAGGTGGNSIALAYTDNDTNIGLTKSGTTLTGGAALATGEDDYDDIRLEIATILKDCVPAGIITQGPEFETITLSNDQSFDFRFNLPERIPITLKLTLTLSNNNQAQIATAQETREALYANIVARYRLGLSFEPQRYFSVLDAPWTAAVLLEYDAGAGYTSAVADLDYDQLYTFAVGDIDVVEV